MQVSSLSIAGAYVFTPVQHGDPRGLFLEAFKADILRETIGHPFDLQQANVSVSAAGVVRGIHFADVPPGQAKYVSCPRGAVLDIIVDIRIGSPTFGQWDSVLLDDADRRSVYISEGLGHAFMALEDNSTIMYLCSAGYNPGHEHGIHPLDPSIGIAWPTADRHGNPLTPQLSDRDLAAPSLDRAQAQGLLPTYEAVTAYIGSLA